MAYYNMQEYKNRLNRVRSIMSEKNLDCAIVYYDEFNLSNAWYLTAWCPQFESGAVFIPMEGEPLILGGPESEPFANMDSAIKKTRNLPVFMVPEEEYPNASIIDFPELFKEITTPKLLKRAGIVGTGQMPVSVWKQLKQNFKGVSLIDITEDYVKLRYKKSPWEIEQIRNAFELTDVGYAAMIKKVKPGAAEFEVAAAGEYAVRSKGANGFGFKAIVGSGKRSNAVVPTAGDKIMEAGELVMLGISPRWKGYAGVAGNTLPVSGEYTKEQREVINHIREAFRLTKNILKPGMTGKEIDAPAREYYKKHNLMKYLVCPFVHTIGLNEAEAPFFGPNSRDELVPGMTVCIDVSLFGHPKVHGIRIETGYEITEKGCIPLSKKMDKRLSAEEF